MAKELSIFDILKMYQFYLELLCILIIFIIPLYFVRSIKLNSPWNRFLAKIKTSKKYE